MAFSLRRPYKDEMFTMTMALQGNTCIFNNTIVACGDWTRQRLAYITESS